MQSKNPTAAKYHGAILLDARGTLFTSGFKNKTTGRTYTLQAAMEELHDLPYDNPQYQETGYLIVGGEKTIDVLKKADQQGIAIAVVTGDGEEVCETMREELRNAGVPVRFVYNFQSLANELKLKPNETEIKEAIDINAAKAHKGSKPLDRKAAEANAMLRKLEKEYPDEFKKGKAGLYLHAIQRISREQGGTPIPLNHVQVADDGFDGEKGRMLKETESLGFNRNNLHIVSDNNPDMLLGVLNNLSKTIPQPTKTEPVKAAKETDTSQPSNQLQTLLQGALTNITTNPKEANEYLIKAVEAFAGNAANKIDFKVFGPEAQAAMNLRSKNDFQVTNIAFTNLLSKYVADKSILNQISEKLKTPETTLSKSQNTIAAPSSEKQKKAENKGTFLIDFDLTISSQHVYQRIAYAIATKQVSATDVEAQWQLVKNITPVGSAEEWKQLFQTLLRDGHNVGIVSFSSFAPIVSRYLRDAIGLTPEEVSRIHVNCWLPPNPNKANKNLHIEQSLAHFNVTNPENVVLVDDSPANISAAQEQRYRTITARPQSNAHIAETLALCQTFNPTPTTNTSTIPAAKLEKTDTVAQTTTQPSATVKVESYKKETPQQASTLFAGGVKVSAPATSKVPASKDNFFSQPSSNLAPSINLAASEAKKEWSKLDEKQQQVIQQTLNVIGEAGDQLTGVTPEISWDSRTIDERASILEAAASIQESTKSAKKTF